MLNLLASRGLFIGLITVVVIVVLLCIGLAALLFFKPLKTESSLDADVIRKELYRRETELVIRIVKDKAEGEQREALIAELRRLRYVEGLVDEIVRTEKSERGIVDKPVPAKKSPARRPAQQRRPAPSESEKPAETNAEAEVAAAGETEKTDAAEKPAEKAVKAKKPAPKKKKNDNEFRPSED